MRPSPKHGHNQFLPWITPRTVVVAVIANLRHLAGESLEYLPTLPFGSLSARNEEVKLKRQRPFRLAVIDSDADILLALSRRAELEGWQLRPMQSAISAEELVGLKLDALLLDPEALGDQGQPCLESVCGRLPDLAVIVCIGRPSLLLDRALRLTMLVDEVVNIRRHFQIAVRNGKERTRRRSDPSARRDNSRSVPSFRRIYLANTRLAIAGSPRVSKPTSLPSAL